MNTMSRRVPATSLVALVALIPLIPSPAVGPLGIVLPIGITAGFLFLIFLNTVRDGDGLNSEQAHHGSVFLALCLFIVGLYGLTILWDSAYGELPYRGRQPCYLVERGSVTTRWSQIWPQSIKSAPRSSTVILRLPRGWYS